VAEELTGPWTYRPRWKNEQGKDARMTLHIAENHDGGGAFDRLPPHSIEAEMCALASMMLDKQLAEQVISILDGESFYLTDHKIIFDAIRGLIVESKPVDAIILRDELKKQNQLDAIGGSAYIAQILSAVPSAAHGMEYAQRVREKSLLRLMIGLADNVTRRCYSGAESADTLLDSAAGEMFKLAERRITNPMMHLGDVAAQVYEMLEDKGKKGVETGFWDLDDMLNGLQPGEMVVVAARPSMGKTAFSMNVMQQIAAQNVPVGVFSLEMSGQQLAQRMLCSIAMVDAQKVRKGQLTNDEYQRLAKVVVQMRKMPIFVDDSPQLTPLDLRTKARRLKHEHDVRALMIDYMQLMDNPGPESRQQQISEISRGIKAVARELGVPVIALSQLNRASENRDGHKPRMSDLRESGSIEQDADVVMLLHREDYYHKADANYIPTNLAEIIIAKQRNGPTGTVELVFDGNTATFKNKAPGGDMM
jgi:replicative DNA helicase